MDFQELEVGQIDREEFEKKFHEEKIECRKEFMTLSNFYRSLVIGIITTITIMTGAVAWAFNVSSDTSTLKSEVGINKERIISVEQAQRQHHNEQMKILKEIKERL